MSTGCAAVACLVVRASELSTVEAARWQACVEMVGSGSQGGLAFDPHWTRPVDPAGLLGLRQPSLQMNCEEP